MPILIFFPILLQNKQKPIRNSCRSNLWATPTLIISNIEFKVLRKKPGDEENKIKGEDTDKIKGLPISIDF